MFEIPELSNPYLRQVAWAIFSPNLLNHPLAIDYVRDEGHYNQLVALLQELDANDSAVNAHFENIPNKPLGKYFEALLHYVLEYDERYDVVLKNHQIIEEKRTVGEIDLILRDTKTNTLEHWEVALKFYLQSKPSGEYLFMVGPNGKDNLEKKMKKLLEHQLPITTDLSQFAISKTQTIENKLLLKGQFFYHLSHNNRCNIIPNDANPDHENGWWCYADEAEKAIDKNLLWTTAIKPKWINKLETKTSHNLLTYRDFTNSIKTYFKTNSSGLMCIGLKEENGKYLEQSRGFIVDLGWPDTEKH